MEYLSKADFLRRSSLRHIDVFHPALVPRGRHIEASVATAVFPDIVVPIGARADDVPIPFTVPGGQATGAAHVAIAIAIDEKSIQEIEDLFAFPIEEIALWLLNLP